MDRNDPGIREPITSLVSSEAPLVREEVLVALGSIGDGSSVPLLIKASSGGGTEAQLALVSLKTIESDGVDDMVEEAIKSADNQQKVNLINVLFVRRCSSAVPLLIREAENSDTAVAVASFKALASLAGAKDLPALVGVLTRLQNVRLRAYAENAAVVAANSIEDKSKRADIVLATLAESTDLSVRISLFRVLGLIANEKAYEVLARASKDSNSQVKDAAIRALAAWPDNRAEKLLLDVVKTSENNTHRVIALRGYVRLLGMMPDGAESSAVKYSELMMDAKNDADKKLILGGLTGVPCLTALKTIEGVLKDKAVAAEAEQAAVNIAPKLVKTHPEDVRRVINEVIKTSSNLNVKKQAQSVLDRLNKPPRRRDRHLKK